MQIGERVGVGKLSSLTKANNVSVEHLEKIL